MKKKNILDPRILNEFFGLKVFCAWTQLTILTYQYQIVTRNICNDLYEINKKTLKKLNLNHSIHIMTERLIHL